MGSRRERSSLFSRKRSFASARATNLGRRRSRGAASDGLIISYLASLAQTQHIQPLFKTSVREFITCDFDIIRARLVPFGPEYRIIPEFGGETAVSVNNKPFADQPVGKQIPVSWPKRGNLLSGSGIRVTIRCGATPPSTRSTSVATVLSPHSNRWRPSTHKSPGSATGCAGGSGASSGRPSLGRAHADRQGRAGFDGVLAESSSAVRRR